MNSKRTSSVRLGCGALLFCLALAGANAGAQQPAETAPETQAAAPDNKSKKVWTNDDLDSGSPAKPLAKSKTAKPARAPSNKDPNANLARQLKARLDKLTTQLADTEHQLDELQRFARGETNGDDARQLHKGYNTTPIAEQIQKLQKLRDDLNSQIEAVYDEARKKGVPPGALR